MEFAAVHSPVDGDDNQHLIFGNLRVTPPADELPPELAAFLGRWEGSELAPPDAIATKAVLFVEKIDNQGGKAYLWAGNELQYPFYVKEIRFRVIPGSPPSIEWQGDLTGAPGGKGLTGRFTFSYDRGGDVLRGGLSLPPYEQLARPSELQRGQSSFVYRNFEKFLKSRRITFHEYPDSQLQRYGWGYLVYLPEGYEEMPDQAWPLAVFLIGTGERGQSVYMLIKHGPLKYVLNQESLPFIIVVPMLNVSPEFRSFPETYLDEVFDEILANYRVDPSRIYLTGISMGGEATYRYALHQPGRFAALAPMGAFDAKYLPGAVQEGFMPFTLPMERIKQIPVWAFHGAQDRIIPLSAAQQTVDALIQAGGDVRFTILEDHGHDVWTEMYADPGLYEWMLEQHKP